ncbi:MAG: ATP-dependent sacrificial sulfur transferase LarE [Deltaproteobacteria bacterium]|nr:ATP-dependent sacrificial sulfur transferase LarE [Deltaproteobacteria bacterium]MBW2072312.1 ATP-dependent sacrificial sulfur transferase LarE [Deltaproteobacteria bacterium]
MDRQLARLRKILADLKSTLVAFSGGVDSSFLLAVALDELGDRAVALTFRSCLVPRREIERAAVFCRQRHARHIIVDVDPLQHEQIRLNPPERCYHCKYQLFALALTKAAELGIDNVIEGSQLSDKSDHRPGRRALAELGIRSPLAEAGFDKESVRHFSRELGLPSWNLPPMACLASRIPYGHLLDCDTLSRVEKAEEFLFDHGFTLVRVRDFNGAARLELLPEELGMVVDTSFRERLLAKFKKLGYTNVSLDLEGYRTGKLNLEIRPFP